MMQDHRCDKEDSVINARRAGLAIALAAWALAPLPVAAQTDEEVEAAVLARDAQFWEAFNRCDFAAMEGFFTADVEFYHDQGGVSPDRASVMEATKRGVCSATGPRVRREAVPGSVRVFAMRDGQTVYGAVFSGDHRFYVRSGGEPERLTGIARFTHLWLLRGDTWEMARILSYDHRPASAE